MTTKWGALLAVGLGVFMATLDLSIVNLTLPTLVNEFGSSFALIQWVPLSYALVLTSLMTVVGRLGDMLGKKKLYATGLGIFTLGSLLCGLSPGVGYLIAFRAIQGLGAVLAQALGAALLVEAFPTSERGRAMGLIGGIVSIGLALGPALGGLIIGLVSWRWVFFVNLPIGVVGWLAARRYLPDIKTRPGEQRFDLLGGGLLLLTLLSYGLGLTWGQSAGFGRPWPLGLLITAMMALAAFVFAEKRTAQPIIDPKLFQDSLFTINLLMGFLVFIVMSGGFILPFYLELVMKLPTHTVGLLMMTIPVSMGLVSPIAGSLSDRFGPRGLSLAGLVLLVCGCLTLSTLGPETTIGGYIIRLLPMGLGLGLFQSPNNSAIMGAVPRGRLGIASGLLSLSRTLGHATGLPLVGTIFTSLVRSSAGLAPQTSVTAAPAQVLVAGITGTYRLAAFSVALSTMLAVLALVLSRRRDQGRQGAGVDKT